MPDLTLIPEGLATKLGKAVAVVLAVLAALTQAGIELDPQAMELINKALIVIGVLMGGRYAQGYAQQRDAQSPAQLQDEFTDMVTDEELEKMFPGAANDGL